MGTGLPLPSDGHPEDPSVMPKPSLKPTRCLRRGRPGAWHSVHHLELGSQRPTTWPARLSVRQRGSSPTSSSCPPASTGSACRPSPSRCRFPIALLCSGSVPRVPLSSGFCPSSFLRPPSPGSACGPGATIASSAASAALRLPCPLPASVGSSLYRFRLLPRW